jgi:hypothetical protein
MPDLEDYNLFNDAVNQVFFDGRNQDLPIYLDLEEEALIEISSIVGLSKDDFEDELGLNVSNTLLFEETNIYKWHLIQYQQWCTENRKAPPPFSALLLTLSLAAEHMKRGDNLSATNYYSRLAKIFGINDEKQGKLSLCGKRTLIFWKALNQWLIDTDCAFGTPTAKETNHWVNVSWALSQSLVRDADRENLRKMFVHHEFSSHEKMSEAEINGWLCHWMTTSEPSKWLKKLWNTPDLKDRVVSAAATELENWKGDTQQSGQNIGSSKLSWAIHIRSLPPQANLFLGINVDDDFVDTKVKPSLENKELFLEMITGTEELELSCQGNEIACLTGKLSLPGLMLASFAVEDTSGKKYKHEPRPIIPMVKIDGDPYFREIRKISLFTTHHVLCHEKWQEKVESHLKKFARPDFSVRSAANLTDLPNEWILFQKVEMIKIPPDNTSNDLQSLVPFNEGVNFTFNRGLKLGPSIWHARALPEISVLDEDVFPSIEVRQSNLSDQEDVLLKIDAGSDSYSPDFLNSMNLDLSGENLVLTVLKNEKRVLEKFIQFRTAKNPRRLYNDRDKRLSYKIGDTDPFCIGVSASPIQKTETIPNSIQGMIFKGTVTTQSLTVDDHTVELSELVPDKYEDEDEDYGYDYKKTYSNHQITQPSESCISRGYHVFMVEEHPSRSMNCQDCGEFQILAKPRKNKNNRGVRPELIQRVAPDIQNNRCLEAIDNRGIDPTVAFDAACYLQAGTWSTLRSVLTDVVEVPWKARVALRNLVDLGLIDVMTDRKGSTPTHWSCPPPAFVLCPNGNGFLSGFRNSDLIDQVTNSLGNKFNKIVCKEHGYTPAPHLWKIEGANSEDILELIGSISDSLERDIKVVNYPGLEIASSIPFITNVIKNLNKGYFEDSADLEKFDFKTKKFIKNRLEGAGAYRLNFTGRRYFFRDAEGQSIEAEFDLVKLLAAREAGIKLHQYNKQENIFECDIGCQPPGLFRRALVSCTGKLPQAINGKLRYHSIPEKLGLLIMNKLYQ